MARPGPASDCGTPVKTGDRLPGHPNAAAGRCSLHLRQTARFGTNSAGYLPGLHPAFIPGGAAGRPNVTGTFYRLVGPVEARTHDDLGHSRRPMSS